VQPAVLQSLFGIKPAKAQRWAKPLVHAMGLADCTTHYRRAAFLAQVGWESGSLTYTREIWGPTAQQKRYDPKTTLAGKLGNVYPGDGRRFMGRGLLQTTGRANYALTTIWLRELLGPTVPDFEKEPELLELDLWAALSAALYWRKRNLNRCVDASDFAELTRRINGGYTHLAERQLLYARALMLSLDEDGLVLKAANDLTYRKAA
jgi:putative chitinase